MAGGGRREAGGGRREAGGERGAESEGEGRAARAPSLSCAPVLQKEQHAGGQQTKCAQFCHTPPCGTHMRSHTRNSARMAMNWMKKLAELGRAAPRMLGRLWGW